MVVIFFCKEPRELYKAVVGKIWCLGSAVPAKDLIALASQDAGRSNTCQSIADIGRTYQPRAAVALWAVG